jgi:hypothetical protein
MNSRKIPGIFSQPMVFSNILENLFQTKEKNWAEPATLFPYYNYNSPHSDLVKNQLPFYLK